MALTRTVQQVEELEFDVPALNAYQAFFVALQSVGTVQSAQPGLGRLTGCVGSGVWNMNRADVTIRVMDEGIESTRVKILVTAQEGLIQQNTAGHAISRILEAL